VNSLCSGSLQPPQQSSIIKGLRKHKGQKHSRIQVWIVSCWPTDGMIDFIPALGLKYRATFTSPCYILPFMETRFFRSQIMLHIFRLADHSESIKRKLKAAETLKRTAIGYQNPKRLAR
jgi:hypothetical protein